MEQRYSVLLREHNYHTVSR